MHLRDVVKRHASTLPIRYIHHVEVAVGDIYLHLMESDGHRTKVAAPCEQDLVLLFHRINNAFVRELTLSFRRADLPLLHYLRANADDLHCRIGALRIGFTAAKIDYDLLDFVGGHLKPRTFIYEVPSYWAGLNEDYAMLFTDKALRGIVKHLVYELDGPSPTCIIPELFGADVVETCAISTNIDPGPWIGKFVEMFETAEPGTDLARSVTLIYIRFGDVVPFRPTVEPLGQPRRIDARTPHSAFVKEWSRKQRTIFERTTTESPVADLFVFENAKSDKKLEVYLWPVAQEHVLHCAFLLQCV